MGQEAFCTVFLPACRNGTCGQVRGCYFAFRLARRQDALLLQLWKLKEPVSVDGWGRGPEMLIGLTPQSACDRL